MSDQPSPQFNGRRRFWLAVQSSRIFFELANLKVSRKTLIATIFLEKIVANKKNR